MCRLSSPCRATTDLDVVDRLFGEVPQLQVLRAALGAEAVEPASVRLPTAYGQVKVDGLEVRPVEIDQPEDDPGDRLRAFVHACASDSAAEDTIEVAPLSGAHVEVSGLAAETEGRRVRGTRFRPTSPGGNDRSGGIVSGRIRYLIGYIGYVMEPAELLEQVRVSAGLTQEELARRAGTSRPTLSAYEHGRKSPTVATFARLLSGAGWELAARPHVSFTRQPSPRGKPAWVPDRLPRLDVGRALAVVELPLHLNWSAPGRVFDLRSRADRARVYEIVLQQGTPADILTYVDGALLVDLWDELVLPRAVRSAWAPLVWPASGQAA